MLGLIIVGLSTSITLTLSWEIMAYQDNSFYMPRELDSKPLIMLWEYDTVVLVIVVFMVVTMIANAFVGMIFCYFTAKTWLYAKSYGGDGMVMRLIYWTFFSDFFVKLPQFRSENREFIG